MSTPLGVKIFLGVVILAVVAAVGFGIYLSNSPSLQRSIRLDQRRLSDLRSITSAIDEYWQTNDTLPKSLEDLRDSRTHVRSISDPSTDERYEYRILTEPTYQLCAVFETDSSQQRDEFSRSFSESVWEHGLGRVCFEREARDATNPGAPQRPPIPRGR